MGYHIRSRRQVPEEITQVRSIERMKVIWESAVISWNNGKNVGLFWIPYGMRYWLISSVDCYQACFPFQLRYYDGSDDQTAKGVILLADAVEILPYTGPFPNALRRFDSRAAFEVSGYWQSAPIQWIARFQLHTNRRIYNFIAATAQDAQTWTEKIKSCLLDS